MNLDFHDIVECILDLLGALSVTVILGKKAQSEICNEGGL